MNEHFASSHVKRGEEEEEEEEKTDAERGQRGECLILSPTQKPDRPDAALFLRDYSITSTGSISLSSSYLVFASSRTGRKQNRSLSVDRRIIDVENDTKHLRKGVNR